MDGPRYRFLVPAMRALVSLEGALRIGVGQIEPVQVPPRRQAR